MSSTTMDLVEKVIQSLQTLDPFPAHDFVRRAYNKAIRAPEASAFKGDLPAEEKFGQDQNSLSINGMDERDLLSELAVHSITLAMSRLDSKTDKPNFRSCVRKAAVETALVEDVTELSTLLFAEFIDWKLKESSMPSLATLSKKEGFLAAFMARITDEQFIFGVLMMEMARKSRIFSLALIFVCEYLQDGRSGNFIPWVGETFNESVSHQVLTEWSTVMLSRPDAQPEAIFSWVSETASLVSSPVVKGKLKLSGGKETRSLVMEGTFKPAVRKVQEAAEHGGELRRVVRPGAGLVVRPSPKVVGLKDKDLEDLRDQAEESFQSIAATIRSFWDSKISDHFIGAVAKMALEVDHSRRRIAKGKVPPALAAYSPALGLANGISGGRLTSEVWLITEKRGADLLEWMKEVRPENSLLFNQRNPTVESSRTEKVQKSSSCFIAGTRVATSAGDVAIEDINEGTGVVTDVVAGRVGIASDEKVRHLLQNTMLVGFNGEGEFVTSGHVFYTTTGPRAIHPDLAREENPFCEIGTLEAGHVLYRRAADGKSYDLVPIKTIQFKAVEAVTVYGIHLREGDRSYHANGYLVAVNYPEVTIKSVAAALYKLPRPARVEMLRKIRELDPLFQKLGMQGIDQALTQELKEAREGHVKPFAKRHLGMNFLDMRKSLSLDKTIKTPNTLTDNSAPAGYQLPTLHVFDGTLTADNQLVRRVEFDSTKGHIKWSRKLADFGYEHGVVRFVPTGLSGQGFVAISDDPNPAELPSTQTNIVAFTVKDAAVTYLDSPDPVTGELMTMDDSRLMTAQMRTKQTATAKAMAASKADLISVGNWRERIRKLVEKLKQQAAQNEAPTSDPQENTTEEGEDEDEEEWIAIEDPGTVESPGDWGMYRGHVDYLPWEKEDEGRVNSQIPIYWGTVALATYMTSVSDPEIEKQTTIASTCGIQLPVIRLPWFDTLRNYANATRADDEKLGPFYRSMISTNDDNTVHARVQITGAAAVSMLSDQFDPTAYQVPDELDESQLNLSYPTSNLTFNNLGFFNATMPMLWSEAEFDFTWDFREFNGACFRFDPSTYGGIGERYFFESKPADIPPIFLRRVTDLSMQAATGPTPTTGLGGTAVSTRAAGLSQSNDAILTAPAPVVESLLLAENLCVDSLMGIEGYSEQALADKSQSLLQSTMLYHMSGDDRTDFLQLPRPTDQDLPVELRELLDPKLKTWIRETYANAYICYMLRSIKPSVEADWRHTLSDDQKEKIWYWWNGAGDKCLARSDEYNKLNQVTAAYAMRSLYPKLNAYVNYQPTDPKWEGKSGGEYWAHSLFTHVATSKTVIDSVTDTPLDSTGSSLVNKICNIAHALYPSPQLLEGYANALYETLVENAVAEIDASPVNRDEEPEGFEMAEWIPDAFRELIAQLLDPQSIMDDKVRKALLDDLTGLLEEQGIIMGENAEEVTQAVILSTVTMIKSGIQIFVFLSKYLDRLSALRQAGAYMSRKFQDKPRTVKAARVLFVAASLASTLVASYQMFLDWGVLTPSQKAQCVTYTIYTMTGQLADSLKLFSTLAVADLPELSEYELRRRFGSGRTVLRFNSRPGPMAQLDARATGRLASVRETIRKVSSRISDLVPRDAMRRVGSWGNSILSDLDPPNKRLPKPLQRLNMAIRAITCLMFVVGIATVVCMTVTLIQDWDNYNELGQALMTTMTVITAINVAVDIASAIFVTVAWLPFVGALLAVAGLIISILLLRKNVHKEEQAPLSAVEEYILNKAPDFIDGLELEPPSLAFKYSVNGQAQQSEDDAAVSFSKGADRTLSVSIENAAAEPKTLERLSFLVHSGPDDNCLFSNATFERHANSGGDGGSGEDDATGEIYPGETLQPGEAGFLRQSGDSSIRLNVSPTEIDDFVAVEVLLQGGLNADGTTYKPLVLAPQERLEIKMRGTVNGVNGDEDQTGEMFLEIVEAYDNGDKSMRKFRLKRS